MDEGESYQNIKQWYKSIINKNVREIDYASSVKTKTIANVVVGLLDCKVRCSDRKTVFQSLKMMYDYCKMLPVRTSTACRGE